jgi:hypothetical protein
VLKALLFLVVLTAVVYVAVSALRRRGGEGGSRPASRRPVAPDDDPAFLRDLDDRLWRDRLHRRRRGEQGGEDGTPDSEDRPGAA